jgi:prolyl-tRNA editing enzyme YbaK/EbsC (Cys-tRNA(Pro) deacylase)
MTTSHAQRSPAQVLDQAGIAYRVHRHPPIHGAEDNQLAQLPLEHCVKTLAFTIEHTPLVLVALPEESRVAYGPLARVLGVPRKQLHPASADLLASRDMTPGGISPIADPGTARVVIDAAVLELPRVFCGSGETSSTLELSPDAFRAACPDAQFGQISRAVSA